MARLRRGGGLWVVWLGLLGYAGVVPANPVGLFQIGGQGPGRFVLPEEEFDLPGTRLRMRRFRAANKHQTFQNLCTRQKIDFVSSIMLPGGKQRKMAPGRPVQDREFSRDA